MKTLIVYYSHTSNNETLAKELQRKLECDLLKIEEMKKRTEFKILLDIAFNRKPAIKTTSCSLKDYDQVIFIAPIWAGKIGTPMKTFLQSEKKNIRRYSFITVCGGVTGQKDRIERQLTTLVGKKPEDVTELWISNLLPKEKKDTVKYTTRYRLNARDLQIFEPAIDAFLKRSRIRFAEA